jgi:hypothetical protein
MNRSPLHAACVAATLASAFVLASPEPARAHVDVQPGLVEQGEVTELRVELPRLRPGRPPTRLELGGAGIELLDSRLLAMNGVESRWIAHVRVDAPPGPLQLTIRALYPDGEVVEVEHALTVVPGGGSGGLPWTAVLIGTFVAVGLGVALLRLARRQPP